MHGNMMLSNSIASNKITSMVRFPKGPWFKSWTFFNVVNFHFRLTELGISGMGMKISLKSVKIWLRYEGLKFEKKVRDLIRGPFGFDCQIGSWHSLLHVTRQIQFENWWIFNEIENNLNLFKINHFPTNFLSGPHFLLTRTSLFSWSSR